MDVTGGQDMLDANVGNRIKKLREMQGLTGEELAERAGISYKYLYEIEAGKRNFSIAVLSKIARNLNVSCDYIVSGKYVVEKDGKELIALFERMDEDRIQSIYRIFKIICEISGNSKR